MAAKVNVLNNRLTKPWNKPGRLAGRNSAVMAVGAWVQPESGAVHQSFEAVLSAADEEARVQALCREKKLRLQQFQADVKLRVAAMERVKRQQQLAQSYKAVEVGCKVVAQSTAAAEGHTPRMNRCLHRDNTRDIIQQSASISTQGGLVTDSEVGRETERGFADQSEKVHRFSRAARRKLTSKRVITEQFQHDDLPGGVWKTGAMRDHPISRQTDSTTLVNVEDADPRGVLEEADANGVHGGGDDTHGNSLVGGGGGDSENSLPHVVRFDPETAHEETRNERITRKSAPAISGGDVARAVSVPYLYHSMVQDAEALQRAVTQRAMYRRLFMDIEREQVKENKRSLQHRRKIAQLKRNKEEERRQEELVSQQTVAAKDPVTGETALEASERHRNLEHETTVVEERRREHVRRSREAVRFVDALKAQLMEKIAIQNVDLPPLCCCGQTIWDTSPETCANNCVFYRNPKAYTRALQSLLASCDVA